MQLAVTLSEETEDHVLAATSWSLGQIGRHTPEHAKAVAATNALPKLLELYLKSNSSEDLQMKVLTYVWTCCITYWKDTQGLYTLHGMKLAEQKAFNRMTHSSCFLAW